MENSTKAKTNLLFRLRHHRFVRQLTESALALVPVLAAVLQKLREFLPALAKIRDLWIESALFSHLWRYRFTRQLRAGALALVPVLAAIPQKLREFLPALAKIRDLWVESTLFSHLWRYRFTRQLLTSALDLAPVLAVVLIFQVLVIRQPIPDVGQLISGMLLVVLGLAFFIQGLQLGLFPLGESMAHAFARKGSAFWLLVFAFALGFGTSVAEPALIAVADEAARIAAEGGLIEPQGNARGAYALGLRLTVALAVGFAVLIGVVRIIRGWPLLYVIGAGYLGVAFMTAIAPPEIVGIAYDSGGVTTSTITVPLVTALAVGLSSSIRGRNPVVDGFGIIAIASLAPMIFVLAYGALI